MFILLKIIKMLNGDAHPAQVAGGALIGCMLGFTPILGAHTAALLCLLFIFRVNIGAGMLMWGATKPLALGLMPGIGVPLGQKLLAPESGLRPFFVWAEKTPGFALIEWEKHVVTGGFVVGFALGALLFVPICASIGAYRTMVKEKIRNSKGMKVASNSLLYKLVQGILEGTPE